MRLQFVAFSLKPSDSEGLLGYGPLVLVQAKIHHQIQTIQADTELGEDHVVHPTEDEAGKAFRSTPALSLRVPTEIQGSGLGLGRRGSDGGLWSCGLLSFGCHTSGA